MIKEIVIKSKRFGKMEFDINVQEEVKFYNEIKDDFNYKNTYEFAKDNNCVPGLDKEEFEIFCKKMSRLMNKFIKEN